ncbi:hypothetical protein OFC38_32075, partial [Escherichia coli]|nr:hypothetical protein [Escherichia coli]
VFILAEDIMDGLCRLKTAHFLFFEVERGVILTGMGLDDFIEIGVLACCVFILAEHIIGG